MLITICIWNFSDWTRTLFRSVIIWKLQDHGEHQWQFRRS